MKDSRDFNLLVLGGSEAHGSLRIVSGEEELILTHHIRRRKELLYNASFDKFASKSVSDLFTVH